MNAEEVISGLGLQVHVEGGYYRRSYCSEQCLDIKGGKSLASSIYYLLSENQPVGHFHKNQSDILHFYHGHGLIRYYLITAQGELSVVDMGSDINQGQQLQLVVPGGTWKASELIQGEFGLISEVVVPEFRYEDMVLAGSGEWALWEKKYPKLGRFIRRF